MLMFPIFVIPIAALLFWLRKKRGWVLTSMYAAYSALSGLLNFFSETGSQPDRPAFDFGNPSTSPIAYLGTFILFGALLLTLCKKDIKEIYNISKNDKLNSMIIGGVIALFIFVYS